MVHRLEAEPEPVTQVFHLHSEAVVQMLRYQGEAPGILRDRLF